MVTISVDSFCWNLAEEGSSLYFQGGPGRGVAEEAFMVHFRRGPGKGVAEEDTGAGRRAAAEGC